VEVGLYADNTLPLAIDRLCESVNSICKTVRFAPGKAPFRLTSTAIVSPSTDSTLPPLVLEELAGFDLACLATSVPYDNNHFFDSASHGTIVSFAGWNALTDLPVTNGFVYFITSILAHSVDLGTTHHENTGCLNDFWWDKSGVDVGMRAAYICSECLESRSLDDPDSEIIADIQALLDAVSQASRARIDLLELGHAATQSADRNGFGVFLCHNSEDKDTVRTINREMTEAGVKTWFDEDQLPPGLPWQVELERQIETVHNVCVFVGKSGFGPWQANETRAFLNEFDAEKLPIIPVLLPDASTIPKLPIFLKQRTWIDLRDNYEANIAHLIRFLKREGSTFRRRPCRSWQARPVRRA
jgi:hypothetical protein